MARLRELWRRGQAGWPRSFPLAQAPNPPLLAAFAGRGLAVAAPRDGRVGTVGEALFVIGLGVWAWEEAVSGVNWFRRLLGLAGLTWLVAAGARRR